MYTCAKCTYFVRYVNSCAYPLRSGREEKKTIMCVQTSRHVYRRDAQRRTCVSGRSREFCSCLWVFSFFSSSFYHTSFSFISRRFSQVVVHTNPCSHLHRKPYTKHIHLFASHLFDDQTVVPCGSSNFFLLLTLVLRPAERSTYTDRKERVRERERARMREREREKERERERDRESEWRREREIDWLIYLGLGNP